MAWLLEAQEIRRHEQAGDRAVRLPTRLAGRHRLVHRNRTDNQRNGGRQVNRIEVLAATPAIEDTYEATIYDYEHAPAKCLYTTKDAADQLYGEYGEEIEVEG